MIMKKLKFFKGVKKERAVSNDDLKSFRTTIEITNYSPQAYYYTGEWVDFFNGALNSFLNTISKSSPDELNVDMLDPYIDSHCRAMMASVRSQFERHQTALWGHRRKLREEISKIKSSLEYLEADLAEINNDKAQLLNKTA